jgi:hypothetical protein
MQIHFPGKEKIPAYLLNGGIKKSAFYQGVAVDKTVFLSR